MNIKFGTFMDYQALLKPDDQRHRRRMSGIRLLAVFSFAALFLAGCVQPSGAAMPDRKAAIAKAVNAPSRPADDVARDADRKPQLVLEFSGIEPGDVVGEFGSYSGYYTRLLSDVVGDGGKVFAYNPSEFLQLRPELGAAIEAIAQEPDYGNVTPLTMPTSELAFPEKLDIAWNTNNYHDTHWSRVGGGPQAAKAINKKIFDALKPGGIYFLTDHSAVEGSGEAGVEFHRIDQAVVVDELKAVGFILDQESDVLRNPADPRNIPIFDPSIRGKTDQFTLRFRKPR